MPHAIPSVAPGLQALILCGPGVSLNTFTSNPEELPKALIPIANRPMVWYALDYCYRMGITSIFLVTPPSSAKAIEAALNQNPHLTSLPVPRATILAPEDLTQTSGTAEILRLPEVRAALQGDFVLLPCDLVCEVPGNTFLERWMVHQERYGGSVDTASVHSGSERRRDAARRGGLGVWYPTKGEGSVKNEETDFIMTTALENDETSPIPNAHSDHLSRLVYSTTTDTLKDIMEEKEHFPVRHALIRRFGRVKMLSTYRDAHFYVFPLWVLEFVERNETFDSISEDTVGWWAKCGWQKGLDEKLGLRDVLKQSSSSDATNDITDEPEDYIDIPSMSSTRVSTTIAAAEDTSSSTEPTIPPMLAYIHPSSDSAQPLIRRVDTTALLLTVSLRLAKLPSIDEAGRDASPFAHAHKVAYPAGVAQRCTVTKADCLLGENVTVEEKSVIKESVIGANCQIRSGAKLTRCVLMDGAVVEAKAQLSGCVVGRRALVGNDCVLKDCEVQDGNKVPEKTDAKGEKFMVFEGLEGDDEDMEGGEGIEMEF